MGDNAQFQGAIVTYPPADLLVSADEAASGKVQRMKLAYSADGVDTHVTADVDGMLVNLGANNDVTVAAGSALIGRVDHASTGVGSGRKVVTTAGTRVTLASSTVARTVLIAAETDNTGVIVVGSAAGVIAVLATREGVPLSAGESLSLPIDNLADVGIDSTVSTDGVTYVYTS